MMETIKKTQGCIETGIGGTTTTFSFSVIEQMDEMKFFKPAVIQYLINS